MFGIRVSAQEDRASPKAQECKYLIYFNLYILFELLLIFMKIKS